MLAVLTGGGTAGHINPALALAEELGERGVEVRFAGTPNGREADLVPAAGIPFKPFEASGFNRSHPTSIVKALRLLEKGKAAAGAWFDEVRPDVVVGFGGYVSLAVGRAAQKRGIPVVIHEQNSVMGLANKDLARHAQAVCLTYGHAAAAVKDKQKVFITGNPVRRSVFSATRASGRAAFGVPADARMLLVTGGSLGARHLNEAIGKLKGELLSREDLFVVQVTGPKELESVRSLLALASGEEQRWKLFGYTDRMGEAMAATDVIVSRAGASSLAEIAARAIPALLVPFPFATEDHQTINARASVDAGCAFMVADDQVESPQFARLLLQLIDDESVRARMRDAYKGVNAEDAARALADVVMKVADRA